MSTCGAHGADLEPDTSICVPFPQHTVEKAAGTADSTVYSFGAVASVGLFLCVSGEFNRSRTKW